MKHPRQHKARTVLGVAASLALGSAGAAWANLDPSATGSTEKPATEAPVRAPVPGEAPASAPVPRAKPAPETAGEQPLSGQPSRPGGADPTATALPNLDSSQHPGLGMVRAQKLVGKVVRADPDTLYLEHMGAVVPLRVDSSTRVVGKGPPSVGQPTVQQLPKGTEVRASFEVRNGTTNLAKTVELTAQGGTGGSGVDESTQGIGGAGVGVLDQENLAHPTGARPEESNMPAGPLEQQQPRGQDLNAGTGGSGTAGIGEPAAPLPPSTIEPPSSPLDLQPSPAEPIRQSQPARSHPGPFNQGTVELDGTGSRAKTY